jgi:hypothetical protein
VCVRRMTAGIWAKDLGKGIWAKGSGQRDLGE